MTDLLLTQLAPELNALRIAVAEHDATAVADTLGPLDRYELEGLIVAFAALMPPIETNVARIRRSILAAAQAFGVTAEDLVSPSRRREETDARAVACYAARLFDIAYSEIGRQVGRDHSTVMHACSRVGADPRLRRIAHRIAAELGWDREDGAVA